TLGVSAFGTAVTLAALMAGLGLGGLFAARLGRAGRIHAPLRAYGLAEIIVGVTGVAVPWGLVALAQVDVLVFAHSPGLADIVHALGVGLLLLVPSVAMGTTLPLLAAGVRPAGVSLSGMYALNTGGAMLGVGLVTFVVLPRWGVQATTWFTAACNGLVGLWMTTRARRAAAPAPPEAPAEWPSTWALLLAFTTGFAVFVLEVSWFRSMRAAFQATTETFSVLIAAFLGALTLGAWNAPRLRARYPRGLPVILALAGCAVLVATKSVDQLDLVAPGEASAATTLQRFGMAACVVIIPIMLLGVPFPWLLDEHATVTETGRLYACNTLGAVTGALMGGFVLLPTLGASVTSWVAGLTVAALAVVWARRGRLLVVTLILAAVGGTSAWVRHEGGARTRVQGINSSDFGAVESVHEGPDSTVWVTRGRQDGERALVIDGFQASGEGPGTTYMQWMGHLPALAVHPLRSALVICFGTGQTANAVRQHDPASLTLVDVNAAVFAAAPLFARNQGVLDDPRVHRVVMDGRAYLRRHPETHFDLITLEPMPPNHAGVNHLYSREFYALLDAHLTAAGSVAQWLPLHLVSPSHMRAIVGAFVQVFPHARLWVAPDGTGVLVAAKQPWSLATTQLKLPLPRDAVSQHFLLDADALRALSDGHPVVTDDNQLLSYGLSRLSRAEGRGRAWSSRLAQDNMRSLRSYIRARVTP
ncbi:MAG: fused MFS/spermidine synthase, partial [Polyangiales bacterium]